MLPTHTAEVGISLGCVGIILGVNRAVRLLLNGPVGLAYDRWPRRRLFLPAVFVGTLSTGIYAATRGFWPLFLGRLLWGLAWSGISVGGATMILDVTTRQDRGRWTGSYQIWFLFGAALGSLAGGTLTDWLGYGATMWAGAGLTGLGGLVALVLLPETRGARMAVAGDQDGGPARPATASLDVESSGRHATGGLWGAITLHSLNRFALSGVTVATLGLLVQSQLQRSHVGLGVATLTGILMSAQMLVSMAAAVSTGTLSDRLASRWTAVAWAVGAGTAGLLLLAWGVPIGILAGVSLVAVAKGSVQPLATALAGDLVGSGQRGRVIGLLHTAGDFGSAVGPLAAYALLPWIGLRGTYLLCAALFAAGLPLALRFRTGQRGHLTAPQPVLGRRR